jgi:hypothetical protein
MFRGLGGLDRMLISKNQHKSVARVLSGVEASAFCFVATNARMLFTVKHHWCISGKRRVKDVKVNSKIGVNQHKQGSSAFHIPFLGFQATIHIIGSTCSVVRVEMKSDGSCF